MKKSRIVFWGLDVLCVWLMWKVISWQWTDCINDKDFPIFEFLFVTLLLCYIISDVNLIVCAIFNGLHEFDDYDLTSEFFNSLLYAPLVVLLHVLVHFVLIFKNEEGTERYISDRIDRKASAANLYLNDSRLQFKIRENLIEYYNSIPKYMLSIGSDAKFDATFDVSVLNGKVNVMIIGKVKSDCSSASDIKGRFSLNANMSKLMRESKPIIYKAISSFQSENRMSGIDMASCSVTVKTSVSFDCV